MNFAKQFKMLQMYCFIYLPLKALTMNKTYNCNPVIKFNNFNYEDFSPHVSDLVCQHCTNGSWCLISHYRMINKPWMHFFAF